MCVQTPIFCEEMLCHINKIINALFSAMKIIYFPFRPICASNSRHQTDLLELGHQIVKFLKKERYEALILLCFYSSPNNSESRPH